MIDSILQNLTKIKKDVIYIDILMNHIVNLMLKEKWQFTRNTYHNLEENVNKYQNGDKTSIIQNYIMNDYETLLQMIYEFKEDLYPIFDSTLFLLLDSFTEDELENLQKRTKKLFSTSPHFSDLQESLLKDESPKIKIFLNNLIHLLNHHVSSQDVKFIPFEMMHSLIALEQFTKEDYLKAYQITTKALKYLQDKTVVKEEYLQMRLNVFIMLAGEKDVE